MNLTRRYWLAAGAAAMTLTTLAKRGTAQTQVESRPVRYPDPAVQVIDPSFAKYRLDNAAVERLATGFHWSEGPV